MSRFGDFCANRRRVDRHTQPITLPLAHARGVTVESRAGQKWGGGYSGLQHGALLTDVKRVATFVQCHSTERRAHAH